MQDHELDQNLAHLGAEQFEPPDELLRATKRAIHHRRAITLGAFVALAALVLAGGGILVWLASPDVASEAKVYVVSGIIAAGGVCSIVAFAVRDRLATFLRKVEVTVS